MTAFIYSSSLRLCPPVGWSILRKAELGEMIAQVRDTGLGHMGREYQGLGYESILREGSIDLGWARSQSPIDSLLYWEQCGRVEPEKGPVRYGY